MAITKENFKHNYAKIKKIKHNGDVITKWKSKHNRMTMTEGNFTLIYSTSYLMGKCCRWTDAPTERPWIRLASVCEKYRLEYTGYPCNVCQTTRRYEILWRSYFYQHLSSIRTVTPRPKWRFIFQSVISFAALILSVAD